MYSWPLNNAGLHCVCLCVSCSVVSDSATPWTLAHQVLLSMKFSRQEYWSGLSFPSLGDLVDPGNEPNLHCRQIPYQLSYKEILTNQQTHFNRNWLTIV